MRRHWMLIAFLAAGSIGFVQAEPPVTQSSGLEALSWMLGDWAFTTDATTTGECWRRAGEATWEGYGFMVRNDDTTRTEDLRLVWMQGDVFYVSKVEHNELPVAFRLVSASDSSGTFANPAHDFPQRILYRKTDEGITARIEGESGGQARSAEYPYLRVVHSPNPRQAPD